MLLTTRLFLIQLKIPIFQIFIFIEFIKQKNQKLILSAEKEINMMTNNTNSNFLDDFSNDWVPRDLKHFDAENVYESPHFIVSLQNYDFYRSELENMPHRKFLDVVQIIKYSPNDISDICTDELSFRDVTYEDLNILGISEDELFEMALSNAENYLEPMLIKASDYVENYDEDEDEDYCPAFFITNKSLVYGASILSYRNINRFIYEEIGDDFYVIPANTHEVFIIGKSCGIERVMVIRRNIDMINGFILDSREFLSSNFYFYDHEADNLILFETE